MAGGTARMCEAAKVQDTYKCYLGDGKRGCED